MPDIIYLQVSTKSGFDGHSAKNAVEVNCLSILLKLYNCVHKERFKKTVDSEFLFWTRRIRKLYFCVWKTIFFALSNGMYSAESTSNLDNFVDTCTYMIGIHK